MWQAEPLFDWSGVEYKSSADNFIQWTAPLVDYIKFEICSCGFDEYQSVLYCKKKSFSSLYVLNGGLNPHFFIALNLWRRTQSNDRGEQPICKW